MVDRNIPIDEDSLRIVPEDIANNPEIRKYKLLGNDKVLAYFERDNSGNWVDKTDEYNKRLTEEIRVAKEQNKLERDTKKALRSIEDATTEEERNKAFLKAQELLKKLHEEGM